MSNSMWSELPRSTIGLLAGASVFALAAAVPAYADDTQVASLDDRERDVIIVTATKREEDLQDVPLTVNVVTGGDFADFQVQNIQELSQIVGGLSLTTTSPSEQSISLRGIKMVSGGGPSSLTVESYLNEVPLSVFDLFSTALDIGQVEVLKGPQGTLRGRPAPSGAVTITTARPSFDGYGGYATATLSDHEGRRVEGAVGGPINDMFAFRVAGLYDYNEGTQVRNINNGNTNFTENAALRASLAFAPNDRFNADVMLQYLDSDQDFYRQIEGTAPCGYMHPSGDIVDSVACGQSFTLFDKIALTEGPNNAHYNGMLLTANATYELRDNLQLAYVGGYNDNTYKTQLDFDFAGIGTQYGIGPLNPSTDRVTYTNELRLESIGNEFYNFTFGVFTQTEDLDSLVFFPPFVGPNGNPGSSTTEDFGLFTNQRFQLSDNDALTLGVRYSKVEITDNINATERSYQAITGNASYQHWFNDDLMAYVSYGTGFRPGSADAFNPPQPFLPRRFGNFEEENSQSLEYGVKALLFDGRVTANVAYFDQEYDGYIAQQFNIACTGVPSAMGVGIATDDGTATGANCFGTMRGNGDAVSKGFEADVSAFITDNWTLNFIYTYTDAHFDNALLPCNDYNGDGIGDTNGAPMVQEGAFVSECLDSGPLGNLPETSWSANSNYDFDLGSFGSYVRVNVVGRDGYLFPQTLRQFEGDTRVNLYLGLTSPDRSWDLSLWAKNLFDEVVEDTDGGDWTLAGNVPSGLRIGTVTNDREIGVTLRRTF